MPADFFRAAHHGDGLRLYRRDSHAVCFEIYRAPRVHRDVHQGASRHELVAVARSLGLEIALDFAIQCSPDHPWLREHPGWFTWRPDANFREYMSGMMDAQVEGAIGGNALRHFVMTVDYPGAAAYFRCIEGCGPIRPRPAP